MLEKQTTTINGTTYEVTQLGAKLGNRVLLKLTKGIAPVFALAAGGLAALNGGSVAAALREISEDDFEWIVDQLAGATVVQLDARAPSLRQVFDLHFAGKYDEELAWLEFAIEANYGPFFSALRAKMAAKLAKGATPTPSISSSPTTSTGASNAS